VYRLENKEEFWEKHQETNQLVMMLQEEIVFTEYFRVYCLGRKAVRIMQYEPRNQPHLRYVIDGPTSDKGGDEGLGYDFNTVEFVRDGVRHRFWKPLRRRIDICGAENFEWVVEESKMAIAAKKQKPGKMNLTWGLS
jgi:hypothetical protein